MLFFQILWFTLKLPAGQEVRSSPRVVTLNKTHVPFYWMSLPGHIYLSPFDIDKHKQYYATLPFHAVCSGMVILHQQMYLLSAFLQAAINIMDNSLYFCHCFSVHYIYFPTSGC